MSPINEPSASRLPLRREHSHSTEERQSEQAGRSATNLHAHVSAVCLRPARPTNVLRKKTRPLPAADHHGIQSAPSSPMKTNQPIRPSVSDGSSRDGSDDPTRIARSRDADAGGVALAQNLPPPPPIPVSRPQEMRQTSSSANLSRMVTPRSVRELGRDFDRYYNPFATPTQSTTDLASPLFRHNSKFGPYLSSACNGAPRVSEEEARRLSNPFSDEKGLTDHIPSDAVAVTTPVVSTSTAKIPMASGNDLEKSFFPYLDDRLGAPNAENLGWTFPLYWHEKEWDDDMHLPMVDDDIKLSPSFKDHFTRENIVSTFGLFFLILGLLCVFIALPVLSWTGINIIGYGDTPLDKMWAPNASAPITWATVNASRTWPLLKNMRRGLIDPDTPQSAMIRTALGGAEYKLVFSDEFNEQNRTFYPGDDPFWFGLDGWYGATQDLEWYDPDAISTWEGNLELRLDAFPNHGLNFRSGMLNSWNQLCFKGGIFEVSVSLPGPAGVHGLWPGVWSMGNLGRPGYLATTDGLWPYTYNDCDVGITPNQSSGDGISKLPGQKLPSCTCNGEEHPTPGTGRGAPEIDIIEVSGDWGGMGLGVATQSFQVAPFDVWWYPNYEFMETPNYSLSFVNTYTGGPYQQAVSTTTMLNNEWYDGEYFQRYAYEYRPGSSANSSIAWYVADDLMMHFDARAIGPNGNIGQRLVSEEPMSLVMNLGISESWVDIDWAALKFPTVMRIDYVRWYQAEGEEIVTCDPPGYETTEYIKNHPEAYNNPNYTHWTDIPGYEWPKNSLMHTC